MCEELLVFQNTVYRTYRITGIFGEQAEFTYWQKLKLAAKALGESREL